MIAIWMMLIMMVPVPMSAVVFPVAVFAERVVVMSVSARVSLVAITIFVVVAFMVATLIYHYRLSDLNSNVYLRLGYRRRRQTDGKDSTKYCEYYFLEHALNLLQR